MPPDRVDYQFTWAEDFTAYAPVADARGRRSSPTPFARNPGQITLIAVGPLQNLGDLVRQHPDVVRLVKRVVLMSGSVGANAWSPTPVAEWNVKLAIDEARAVYAAAWPLTIVPLDSTTYVRLEDAEREALQKAGTPLVLALEALYRLWADEPSSRMTLHDQLAVAEAQEPGRFFGTLRAAAAARRRRGLHARRQRRRPPGWRVSRAQARRVHEALPVSALGALSDTLLQSTPRPTGGGRRIGSPVLAPVHARCPQHDAGRDAVLVTGGCWPCLRMRACAPAPPTSGPSSRW